MQSRVMVGIDVGGTKVLGLAVDDSAEVLAEERVPTPVVHGARGAEVSADALLEALASVATRLAGRLERDHGRLPRSVGVGVPGWVDDSGVLRFAPNLPIGGQLDIGRLLGERLPGWHVVVDNDSTCATVAEWAKGSAMGVSDAVMVALGTGIGGGIIAGGRVVRGANGFAGEIGHMIVDPSGPVCPCGRRGCWERYASGSGLGRLAREAAQAGQLKKVASLAGGDPESVRGEHVTEAAAAGDQEARAVLEELGRWLALGLGNLANILDTRTFVIGGGLLSAIRMVLESVRLEFRRTMGGRLERPEVDIVLASLGERAGAIGAALVGREPDRHKAGSP